VPFLFVSLSACVLTACAPPPGSERSPTGIYPTESETVSPRGEDIESIPTRSSENCTGIDSTLQQIIQSENPVKAAKELGLATKENKIQVILVLEDEKTDFLANFDTEITAQSSTQVQAFVPIDRLCELAGMQTVLAIHPPALATGD
jgi:hypothetical protein